MNNSKSDYKVSVRLMCYNHEDFIREAMDGIIMQKTNFKVEVVVGDDFSKDDTLQIIREYENTDNIHIRILEREKGDKYWNERKSKGRLHNFLNILENCTGEYIALLDGDDYWTDSLKLQKQVDFLEENNEYVLSHSNCDFLFQEKGTIKKSVNDEYYLLDLSSKKSRFKAIAEGKLKIRTGSVVIRNHIPSDLDSEKKFRMGDTPLWLILSQYGKFHYLKETTMVYRISNGTVSRNKSTVKKIGFKLSGLLMRFYYYEKFNYKIPHKIIAKYEQYLVDYVQLGGTFDFLRKKYLSDSTLKELQKIDKNVPLLNELKFYSRYPKALIFDLKQKLFKK